MIGDRNTVLTDLNLEGHTLAQGPPKRIPRLHDDVLLLVAHWINRPKDASSFMFACRKFHTMATPTLLRRGVKLGKEAELHSFHAFLFSNFHVPPRPFRYFRKLNLEFTDVGVVARNLDILTDIFSHASHLQDLSMGCFERLLENGPETFEAMATLPNLTSLTVDLIGKRGAKYLRDTTSPISNLTIGMVFRLNPIKLKHLWNIGATLTHLEIDCEGFEIAPRNLTFDHLRTLKMRASSPKYLPSPWIFGPFPQLKHLIVVEYNSETPLAQAQEGHQQSLAELSRYKGPIPHLDVLVGDPLTFHRLSFFCPVRALFLDRFCQERSLVLPRIIAESQPYLLRIVLDAHDVPLDYFAPLCDEISEIASLKELWLRLNFEKGLNAKSKSLLQALPLVLSQLSLQVLSIYLDLPLREYKDGEWSGFESILDPEAFVTNLAKVSSTLRHVEMYSPRRTTRAVWKAGDQRAKQERGNSIGWDMIRYYFTDLLMTTYISTYPWAPSRNLLASRT